MTWSARIEHTPTGVALTFGEPLSRLDMAPDVARHLAKLLDAEAQRLHPQPPHLRVVATVAKTEELRGFERWRRNPNGSELCRTARQTHPLCCDDDCCLNGGHR